RYAHAVLLTQEGVRSRTPRKDRSWAAGGGGAVGPRPRSHLLAPRLAQLSRQVESAARRPAHGAAAALGPSSPWGGRRSRVVRRILPPRGVLGDWAARSSCGRAEMEWHRQPERSVRSR